jgi:hypothetical protein
MTTTTTTRPLTTDELTAALNALGDTPDHVADTLFRNGHRGHRGCDTSCPVAQYLTAVFPTAVDISVDTVEAIMFPPNSDDSINVTIPEPVREFIYRFDSSTSGVDPWRPELDWTVPLDRPPA